jgi:hypothetical protein
MKNIFRDSTILKAKILSYGFRISEAAEELIDETIKEEHRGYGDSHWGVKKTTRIPSEIILPGDIVVASHIRPKSRLCLDAENGKPIITNKGVKVSDVSFLKRPQIWSKKTKSGINMKRIANFYGRDCLNFNIYSGCEFWEKGVPCKFCSVMPTQLRYGEVAIKKEPKDVREVAKTAFALEDKINFVIVTGGSYLDGDMDFDMAISALKEIKKEIPKSWNGVIRGNVALMAPKNLEKIDELMATGIEHPSFNLEVWGKKYFNYICPGKAKYRGLDHIMEAYKYGVKKYGRGVFWVNFVGGLNDIKTLKKGFTQMAKMGVVPGANIFHPDVGSVLGTKRKSPSPEYIIELYKHAAKLYHKYGYKPYFDEKCLRNSIANEAYLGYV